MDDQPKQFVGIKEAMAISGYSKSAIRLKILSRTFPQPVIREKNVTRFDLAELLAWREEQFRKRDERLKAQQPEAVAA